MSEPFDVKLLLGLFLDEASDHIDNLETSVLSMGPGPISRDTLERPFRAAHTLKGSARTMGYEDIGGLAHTVEDCLDQLRSGTEFGEELREKLLALIDGIRVALAKLVRPAVPARKYKVRLDPNAAMKAIRAELLLRELEALGTIVSTTPPRAELDHAEFTVEIETDADESDLMARALSVSEVRGWEPANDLSHHRSELKVESTVRVAVARLDETVELTGELVVERARLVRLCQMLLADRPDDSRLQDLVDLADRMAGLVGDLQRIAMSVRMLPIDGLFRRIVRAVHDLSAHLEKPVDVLVEGGETEVERSVLDALGDPLIHMIRNSMDHGIESPAQRLSAGKSLTGSISLRARIQEGEVLIDIEDDGKGIDAERVLASAVEKGVVTQREANEMSSSEALQLIFRAGFSTATQITQISGRGVGMDIVMANLERLGGRMTLATELGRGTKFSIALPVSLTIVRCLLVRADGATYAIPELAVRETLRLDEGQPTAPFVDLGAYLEQDPELTKARRYAVVVKVGGEDRALGVDHLVGEQELVVKPLAPWLASSEAVAGASIMADGRVVLTVDPHRMAEALQFSSLS